jgi:hypothetical protein
LAEIALGLHGAYSNPSPSAIRIDTHGKGGIVAGNEKFRTGD